MRKGSVLAALAGAAALLVASSAAIAQDGAGGDGAAQRPFSAPSFAECEALIDEEALRAEIFEGARATMRQAAENVDYATIVRRSWIAARFDTRFAEIVDAKIEILRADRSYLERLLDGNVPSRAREMAERTADLVFMSDEFETLQDDLRAEIGERLRPELRDALVATESSVARCIDRFLRARYAQTVTAAFSADRDADDIGDRVQADDIGLSVALSLSGVIAGILAVAFRRLVRRVVASIVRRLAGAIAARLAAWASVVAGVALLVYELVSGADGVFPIIRDELLSVETKREIQMTLIDELSVASPEQLDVRASEIAAEMFERWRSFQVAHRAVLRLASEDPAFRAFLETQPPERFEALSYVIETISTRDGGGVGAVSAALESGLLADAMAVPEVSARLERWGPRGLSLEELILWDRLAGDRFDRAARFELPAVVSPRALDRASFDAIMETDDPRAAQRLASLPEGARAEALGLPLGLRRDLALGFDADRIARLFELLAPVADRSRRGLYIERAVTTPGLLAQIDSDGAVSAVRASASPAAALEVLFDPAPSWSPIAYVRHTQQVLDGAVDPRVLAHRYGWALVIGVGLPLLLVLGVLRSVGGVFRRRRR